MEKHELSLVRHYLGKTQKEMANLMCVSPKAVQSFEEGWRHIPVYIERQILLLLSLKRNRDEEVRPCWEMRKCPAEWRENCAAWEFQAGYLCWFINGTFCHGKMQEKWEQKMTVCRQCEVFLAMVPPLI